MKKYILSILITLAFLTSQATIRYATNHTGLTSGSGLTVATALSFTYAISSGGPVVAGDTVYVAAGSYTGTCTFQKSGTATNPITYQGYTSVPGDQPTILVLRANPWQGLESSSVMPLFTGTNRNTGTCFDMTGVKYVNLRNFMATAYSIGVATGSTDTITSSHNSFFNVNFQTLGSTSASYDGKGFLIGSRGVKWSDWNTLSYCYVMDVCAEGIDFAGDHNTAYMCYTYNQETVVDNSFMDYHFITASKYNTFNSCYAYTTSTLAASSSVHHFTCKGNREAWVDAGSVEPHMDAQYNFFINCTARNSSGDGFTVRHRGSSYNVFYHCYAYGTHTGANGSGGGKGNLITIRDGASYNLYYACYGDSLASGIYFTDTNEDETGVQHTSDSNYVYSCVIANTYIPIRGVNTNSLGTDCGANVIQNCSFVLGRYMLDFGVTCNSLSFKGNIFYGASGVADQQFDGGTYHPVAGQYTDNDIYLSTTGTTPILAATGTMTVNPTYVNIATRDLRLQASSTLRDKCTHISLSTSPVALFATQNNKLWQFNITNYNLRDYNGVSRRVYGSYQDMGAYEYHP